MDKVYGINRKNGQVGVMFVYHKLVLSKQYNVGKC